MKEKYYIPISVKELTDENLVFEHNDYVRLKRWPVYALRAVTRWYEIMRRAGNPNLGEAAPSPFKRLLTTIDATPTWISLLPALLIMSEHGSQEAKLFANEELRRMANTADQFVAARKLANDIADQRIFSNLKGQ